MKLALADAEEGGMIEDSIRLIRSLLAAGKRREILIIRFGAIAKKPLNEFCLRMSSRSDEK